MSLSKTIHPNTCQRLLCICFFAGTLIQFVQAQTAKEYYESAALKREAGLHEAAIQEYTQAILNNPVLTEAHAERGYCYSHLEKYREALTDYEKAVSLGSQDPLVYLNRGWAKYNLGQKKEACLDWKMAKQLGYGAASDALQMHCMQE